MDSIVLASDSLDTLALLMSMGFMLMGLVLALMGGTMLAWAMLPFSPSDAMAEPSEFHSTAAQLRYNHTQYKLALIREQRKALLQEPSDSVLATRIEGIRPVVVC